MNDTRILVVLGSRTSENRYGIISGNRVADALCRRGATVDILHARDGTALLRRLIDDPPDLVVPVGFGAPCEDGHVHAVARLADVPCAGPTPATGGLMQDKSALSRMVDSVFAADPMVRSPRGTTIRREMTADDIGRAIEALAVPLVIKPCFSGSSEGLQVNHGHAEAVAAVTAILEEEGKVVVQQLELPLAEVSCTVLDRADGPQFLPIVELRRDGGSHDDGGVLTPEKKFGAEGLDRHIIPARLCSKIVERIKVAVLTLHRAIGAIGLSRTDLLVMPDGTLVILEVNGIPGLLESSIACDAARAAGIEFDELAALYAASAYIPRPEPKIWERQS